MLVCEPVRVAVAAMQGVDTNMVAAPLVEPVPHALLTRSKVYLVVAVGPTVNVNGEVVILVKTCPVFTVTFQGLVPVKTTESITVCPGELA